MNYLYQFSPCDEYTYYLEFVGTTTKKGRYVNANLKKEFKNGYAKYLVIGTFEEDDEAEEFLDIFSKYTIPVDKLDEVSQDWNQILTSSDPLSMKLKALNDEARTVYNKYN